MKAFNTILLALALLVTAMFAALRVKETFFTDRTPPVISFASDVVEASVTGGDAALLAGVSARDDQDGDLSGEVRIRSVSQLIGDATAQVSYIVFDEADNMAVATRTVHYTDYRAPRFAISQPLVYDVGTSATLSDRLTAEDVVDGDITGNIRLLSSSLDISNEGVYHIVVRVTNSMGDSVELELPLVVHRTSSLYPTITLTDQLVYLAQGADFSPADYFESVREKRSDEGVSSMAGVRVTSEVDTSQPGVYEVRYDYENQDGYEAVAILTVVVE